MKRLVLLASAGVAALVMAGGVAATELPDYLKGLLESDPAFVRQSLVLADVPAGTGPAVSLFNGRDLNDWTGWLGYSDPALTYNPQGAAAIGAGGIGSMFTVVEEDGAPALRVDGSTWGSLMHKGVYGNYHLTLEYKFSGVRHAPRLNDPENNGLLYHSYGEQGAVWGTWARAVEFEIMTGSTGMVVPVGDGLGVNTAISKDEAIIDPKRRFMVGGREAQVLGGTAFWNVENHADTEKPVGQWNRIDLYVIGDHAIHVVNGVPVMEVWRMCSQTSGSGRCLNMTEGHIQVQSEGAEVFFRNIELEPIESLPRIVVR